MAKLSKAARSWCLYDVANSVYATSVMTFIFPIYLKSTLVGDSTLPFGIDKNALLPILTAISLAIVFFLSPLLGALADQRSSRKKYLFITTMVGSLGTLSLGLYPGGAWIAASLAYLAANISFVLGTLFYNSLLKEVATDEELPKVSGFGWAIGYTGGFLAMCAHLFLIMKNDLFGISKVTATQIALGTSGLWWLLISLPLFKYVKETQKQAESHTDLWSGFNSIPSVLKTPMVGTFIIAFFFFNDAIQTTISQAANMADGLFNASTGIYPVVGLDTLGLVMQVGAAIQLVAIIGSFAFIYLERWQGTLRSLKFALFNWVAILVWAFYMNKPVDFWILGIWVGLVMGVGQSAARTYFAGLAPRERSAEFFAVYSLADRGGSMLGPMLFALAVQLGDIRHGVIPIFASMCLGTLLVLRLRSKS